MSSDNDVLLRGSMKDVTNPISYDKEPVPSQKISHRHFVETDIRGFGTKVGTYSNYSTIIEAMRPLFPSDSSQSNELLLRKKLLREINGQEIDRIKGVDAKGPPKDEWLKYQIIDPDDSEDIKRAKYYHNSLVIAKKPYFFRYLYPELNDRFKQYEHSYNETARCMFRTPLKKLLAKSDKTEAEKVFIRRYHKFSPVINTNCVMNLLCKSFENTVFEIRYNKKCNSLLPHYDIDSYKIDPAILSALREIYRKSCNRSSLAIVNSVFSDPTDDQYDDLRSRVIGAAYDEIIAEYNELKLEPMDGLTYFYALSLSYTKFNWDVVWRVMEDQILSCIPEAPSLIPVEDPDGEEFLGRRFSLKPIYPQTRSALLDYETDEEMLTQVYTDV